MVPDHSKVVEIFNRVPIHFQVQPRTRVPIDSYIKALGANLRLNKSIDHLKVGQVVLLFELIDNKRTTLGMRVYGGCGLNKEIYLCHPRLMLMGLLWKDMNTKFFIKEII